MHYSGILVVAAAARGTDDCARRLEELPGVEVRLAYPESGRLIAVQETATASEQEAGLRRIQALPGVAFAALVNHLIDADAEPDRKQQEPRG